MNRSSFSGLLLAALIFGGAAKVCAQGTAFLYQGRLNDAGAPANAAYDLRFALYDAVTNGNHVGVALTNAAVPVSNGLFTVTLDFDAGIFTGPNYWLDLAVRATNAAGFTGLAPRQPVLPVPYAIFAGSASNLLGTIAASQLTGTLPSTLLSGAYSGSVNFSNGANGFTGTFAGNGAALTNLNGTNITTGTIADLRLSTNVALLNRSQTFTGTNVFAGFNSFTNATNFFNGAFSGNGAALTNLNGSQITTGTVADPRLSTNVALLNRNQTFGGSNLFTSGNTFAGSNQFTGANTFNGANNFSNFGNNFSGSFFGNGLVGWTNVSGVAQQAMRDHGYMLTSASLTTVTLPATSGLTNGDIVRISGAGAGGWLVAENSGQSILGNFASYGSSYLVTLPAGAAGTDFHGVAASADGVRIYAVGNNITGVFASSDSGRTWGQVSSTGASGLSGSWFSVACSADGKTVYAEPYAGGTIQKSTDSGVDWSATTASATGIAIACSADGSTLFYNNIASACSGNGTYLARINGGVIQISSNGNGGSWNNVATAPAAGVSCLGASSDCTRLVAGVSNGLLYASSNQGATWTTLTTTNQVWSGAWMSPDGSKFAATVSKSGSTDGGIYNCNVSVLPNTSTTISTGSIYGSQGSAVELQYIGYGQFMPVSSTGLLWAN